MYASSLQVALKQLSDIVTPQLDRNAIAQARLDGLEDDLGLVGSQYNTCISILFVG